MTRQINLDWLGEAACGTVDGSVNPLFFPEDQRGRSREVKAQIRVQISAAKAVCSGVPVVVVGEHGEGVVKWGTRPCPVREQCLALAMRNEGAAAHLDRAGIFGGLTPKERAAMAPAKEAPPRLMPGVVRKRCLAPGTVLGAGKHMLHDEPPCIDCEPYALGEDELAEIQRMVETGYPNHEIFRKSMASAAHVRAVRVALNVPDPKKRAHFAADAKTAARRSFDPAKVERRMAGYTATDNDWKLRLTGLERREVVRRGVGLGLNDAQISRNYGIHRDQVRRDRVELGLVSNYDPLNPEHNGHGSAA